MSEPSGAPSPAAGKKVVRRRPNRKPASTENTESADSSGSSSKKTPKRKPENSRTKGKPKAKAAKLSNKARLAESIKLIKRHTPATVNGVAVSKLVASRAQPDGEEPTETKKPTKKEVGDILAAHLDAVVENNPEQPIYLSFILHPSDPEFPYDLESLNFNLSVPAGYPAEKDAFPSIVVLNTNIPRGFSVNIEAGFRSITRLAKGQELPEMQEAGVELVSGSGLRSQVDTLNKHLEYFLSKEKKQTVKFITFKNAAKPAAKAPAPVQPQPPKPTTAKAVPQVTASSNFTKESLHKRSIQVQEMCTKLSSHIKLFNESKTEARYKVSFPIGRDGLPVLWTLDNSTVDVFLTVPISYPLEPPKAKIASNFNSNLIVAKKSRVEEQKLSIMDVVSEAKAAERNFNDNAGDWHSGISLVQYLNTLHISLPKLTAAKDEYQEKKATMQSFRQAMETTCP